MKSERKKDPNSYPLLAFRVSEESKEELVAEIKKVCASYNKALRHGDKKFRMNDIVIEALRRGLRQMKK